MCVGDHATETSVGILAEVECGQVKMEPAVNPDAQRAVVLAWRVEDDLLLNLNPSAAREFKPFLGERHELTSALSGGDRLHAGFAIGKPTHACRKGWICVRTCSL